jgi:hypothetical protein
MSSPRCITLFPLRRPSPPHAEPVAGGSLPLRPLGLLGPLGSSSTVSQVLIVTLMRRPVWRALACRRSLQERPKTGLGMPQSSASQCNPGNGAINGTPFYQWQSVTSCNQWQSYNRAPHGTVQSCNQWQSCNRAINATLQSCHRANSDMQCMCRSLRGGDAPVTRALRALSPSSRASLCRGGAAETTRTSPKAM